MIALLLMLLLAPPAQAKEHHKERKPSVWTQRIDSVTAAEAGIFTPALFPAPDARAAPDSRIVGCAVINTGRSFILVYFRTPGTTASIAASMALRPGSTLMCGDGAREGIDVAGSEANSDYVVLVFIALPR